MKKSNSLILLLLSILVFGQSCERFYPDEVHNLNDGKVLRIGHGGLGFVSLYPFNPYPANSFKALKLALEEYKADGIEVDLQMTSDNKLVLYHDNYLDSKTHLKNCVSNYDYDEIAGTEYKLGIPYDWFQSEKIIDLESLLTYVKATNLSPLIHIDIRHFSHCLSAEENEVRMYQLVDELLESLMRNTFPLENVLLNSSSFELCNYIMRKEARVDVSFEINTEVDNWIPKVHSAGIKYVTIKPKLLDQKLSERWHNLGIQVITFGGARKKWNIELLRTNPDIIQTDHLSSLNELLLE